MNFGLSEQQGAVRAAIREFVERECPPKLVNHWEDDGVFPEEVWEKLAEQGWLALPFPDELGGAGGSYMEQMLVLEQLGWAFPSLAHMYTISTLFGGKFLQRFGNPEQKALIKQVIAGKLRFCLGMTEPNAGSDAAALTTRAVREADEWVVNGAKIFSTGAHMADYILLFARTDPNLPRHKGVSCFLVNRRSPGITPRPMRHLGCNAVQTCEVHYDNVRLPAHALIGELNQGWSMMLTLLDIERCCTAAYSLGLADRALNESIAHAKNREQFGQPIGKFQAVSHMLADGACELEAARLLTWQAVWKIEQGLPASKDASYAKLKATEVCKQICLNGVQIMGGYGYMMEYDMQRYLRDSIIGTIFGGSSQIQRNIIAKQLGL